MRASWLNRSLFLLLACMLICLLAACDMPWSASSSQASTSHNDGPTISPAKKPTPATSPVPTTKTSCPASGSARALITAPLIAGDHQNIIYAVSEYTNSTVTLSSLKRYDVQTGSQKVIVQISNKTIGQAEVSPDGQWILYMVGDANAHTATMIQAVRTDGQGQQTLYCSASTSGSINNVQWSPDQKWLAFEEITVNSDGTSSSKLQLLNLATGKLQTVFLLLDSAYFGLNFHSWLDATHIYLYDGGPDGLTSDIYILDITKGANQQKSGLATALKGGYKNFVSSYDRSQIYVDFNGCDQVGCKPPSSIMTLPAMGGTQHTFWQSTKDNLTQVCPVNSHQLLVTIESINAPASIDTSRNGTWIMNNDGTGMKQLSTISNTNQAYGDCLYSWNIASRDSSMYALFRPANTHQTTGLIFGKLDGSGSPTLFAATTNNLQASVVGWTTM